MAFDRESRELQLNYGRQIRELTNRLTAAVNQATTDLYATGYPDATKLADTNARLQGIANAAAFQLSSQLSLLPGSSQQVARLQDSLLGDGPNSLTSRLRSLTQAGGSLNSARFQSLLSRTVNNAVQFGTAGYANLFRGSTLYNAAVDPTTGQRLTLPQYFGNQLINQVGNTLGSFGQTFASVGNSTLFANGATVATPEAAQAFAAQYGQALGLVASQIGAGLSLFPNAAAVTNPLIFSDLYILRTPQVGLAPALGGLTSRDGFETGVRDAIGTGFQNVASRLGSAFGLPTGQNFSMPTNNFTNVFGSRFSNFGNGFNNGFNNTTGSTGFYGFGTPGIDFNTNFSTGFNNYVTTLNQNLGLANPGIGTGTGTGTGTGIGMTGLT
ncbi:MAG: hypothetical protein AB7I30_07870 [Isosphaeraceae bacterium]